MLFAFRNFKRNKMVNLSATSIRHFVPSAEIYCITFYENDINEYDEQPALLPFIHEKKVKTKYPNTNGKPHDHLDFSATSGQANPESTKYFSEGYNQIWDLLNHRNEKVFMLGEDSFFTTGEVLKEVMNPENFYAVAFGSWCWWGYEEKWANAAFICFDFKIIKEVFPNMFPISEEGPSAIENHLYNLLVKIPSEYRYIIKHRTFENYHGDGIRTNSSVIIEQELKKVGIV